MTLVAGVNRMMEAESSRMTPMKMKHQAAMMPLRARGAVTSRRMRSRPAPRIRPASSSSGGIPRKVASDCPVLGGHLDRSVQTGLFCAYEPDPGFPVEWRL